MDTETAQLIAALVGPGGVVAVLAYLGDRRRQAAAKPEPSPAPADDSGQSLERLADRVDLLIDQLVEERDARRALRHHVWVCPVDRCPVRDHLSQDTR